MATLFRPFTLVLASCTICWLRRSMAGVERRGVARRCFMALRCMACHFVGLMHLPVPQEPARAAVVNVASNRITQSRFIVVFPLPEKSTARPKLSYLIFMGRDFCFGKQYFGWGRGFFVARD